MDEVFDILAAFVAKLVGIALLTTGLLCLGKVVFGEHTVDGYYLSNENGGNGTCVYAHWTNHTDEKAFCTDDYQKALDFATRANQAVVKGH